MSIQSDLAVAMVKNMRRHLRRYLVLNQSAVKHMVSWEELVRAFDRFHLTHFATIVDSRMVVYKPTESVYVDESSTKIMDLDHRVVFINFLQNNLNIDSICVSVGENSDKVTPAIKVLGHYARILKDKPHDR